MASPMRAAAKPSCATRPTNSSFSLVKPKPLMPKNCARRRGGTISFYWQCWGCPGSGLGWCYTSPNVCTGLHYLGRLLGSRRAHHTAIVSVRPPESLHCMLTCMLADIGRSGPTSQSSQKHRWLCMRSGALRLLRVHWGS